MAEVQTDTFPRLAELLVNRVAVPVSVITREARLRDDLGLNDDDAVAFVIAVEDAFGIVVEHRDYRQMNTLGEFADLVEALRYAEQFGEVAP